MPTVTRLRAAALAGLLMLGGAGVARGSGGEVSAAEDNPPGCTKATGESNDGCGAKGRDHFANANHRAPVEACAETTAPSGSRLTRIRPDGPRRTDGSLAFVSGACVYLPPGYATSGLRYPVVHVLHGGGGDQADWVTFGDIRGVLDRAYAADPSRAVIAVMPDGRSGQWYDYENGRFLIETYVLDHLLPYVDGHFRTIADRTGRAVVGLSNGGYGAIHLAGKRPDFFVAAGGMSSNLGARTLSGLGADGAVHHQGSVPYQLAENYDEVDLVLDVATYCTSVDPLCATIAVDLLFTPDHLAFDRRMDDIDHQGELDLRLADGAHQFRWWTKWLEERQLPYLQQRLADPQPATTNGPASKIPAEFRYRSIKPTFSVWGFDVTVERKVREFLDLSRVSAGGFTVRGSGRAVVRTAAFYAPGAAYSVAGAAGDPTAVEVVADGAGRLTVPVDLGPSHTADQFTDEADLAEARGNYWTTRTVAVTPVDGGRVATATDLPPAPRPGAASASFSSVDGPGPVAATGQPQGAAAESERRGGIIGAIQRAVAPLASEPGPQVVPTALFLAALAAGPAVWWKRRRAAAEEDA